jgi:hypothetical protein
MKLRGRTASQYYQIADRYCCLCSHASKTAHRRALKDYAECLAAYDDSLQIEKEISFSTDSDSLKTSSKAASPWEDQNPISSPMRSRDKSSVIGTGCRPVAASCCFEVNQFLEHSCIGKCSFSMYTKHRGYLAVN